MGVPVNSLASPRFCGVRTFQRLPHSADCSGNDFAVLGVPFDTATSYRPGCRFGPAAIRDASSILKSYHSVLDVDIFEHCQGVDAGDVDIIPGYLDESFERIEAAVAGVLDAGAVPVIMGGDHSITLPELRAVAKRHGPVTLLHFDAHSDTGDDFSANPTTTAQPSTGPSRKGRSSRTKHAGGHPRPALFPVQPRLRQGQGDARHQRVGTLHDIGVDETIRIMRERIRPGTPVFVTFDIDFLDAAYAPGTDAGNRRLHHP